MSPPFAGETLLVGYLFCNEIAAGSNPVAGSSATMKQLWGSTMVVRSAVNRKDAGSSPAPTAIGPIV